MFNGGKTCALADLSDAQSGIQQKLGCRSYSGFIELLRECFAKAAPQKTLGLADTQVEDRCEFFQRQSLIAIEKGVFDNGHQPCIGHGRHGRGNGFFLLRLAAYTGKRDNDLLEYCLRHLRSTGQRMSVFFDQLPEQREETAFILTDPECRLSKQCEETRLMK